MNLQGSLNLKGLNGGRDRTRTCDLLRVKLPTPAISLSTKQIFLQETSIYAPKVHSWVGNWVGRFRSQSTLNERAVLRFHQDDAVFRWQLPGALARCPSYAK
jgi:hypothetical protein